MRQIHGYCSPISCPEQHPGCVQGRILNISRDGDFTQPLWETWPTAYKSPLMFPRNLRSFVLCPLAPALPQGTTEKSLFPSGFLPIKYLLSCLLATPALHWWLELFHPTGRTWHFLFVNITQLFTNLGAQMFSWISVHLTVHSFKPNIISLCMMMLGGSFKSLAKVKTNITHSSTLIHQTCHLIVESCQTM